MVRRERELRERCRQENSYCALKHVQLNSRESRGGKLARISEHQSTASEDKCLASVGKLPSAAVSAVQSKITAGKQQGKQKSNSER
jgi:hypothetical protein